MNSISKVYSQDFDYEKQKKENSSIFREKYLKQNIENLFVNPSNSLSRNNESVKTPNNRYQFNLFSNSNSPLFYSDSQKYIKMKSSDNSIKINSKKNYFSEIGNNVLNQENSKNQYKNKPTKIFFNSHTIDLIKHEHILDQYNNYDEEYRIREKKRRKNLAIKHNIFKNEILNNSDNNNINYNVEREYYVNNQLFDPQIQNYSKNDFLMNHKKNIDKIKYSENNDMENNKIINKLFTDKNISKLYDKNNLSSNRYSNSKDKESNNFVRKNLQKSEDIFPSRKISDIKEKNSNNNILKKSQELKEIRETNLIKNLEFFEKNKNEKPISKDNKYRLLNDNYNTISTETIIDTNNNNNNNKLHPSLTDNNNINNNSEKNSNININSNNTNIINNNTCSLKLRARIKEGNYIKASYIYSRAGKKDNVTTKTNQDSYLKIEKINGFPDFNIFGIFDGHGSSGHLVSKYIVNFLTNYYITNKEIKSKKTIESIYSLLKKKNYFFIKDSIKQSEESLFDSDEIDSTFSGTTCILLFIIGNKIISVNIGDSRAIMIKDKRNIIELSKDQKPENLEEKERIEKNGGELRKIIEDNEEIGPMRVWVKGKKYPGIAMSRSIGDSVAKEIGVCSDPEIKEFFIDDDNYNFIVIGSDGLWEFMSNEKVGRFVYRYKDINYIKENTEHLVEKARKYWEKNDVIIDDITVVMIYLKGEEE